MSPNSNITFLPISESTLPDLQALFFAIFGRRFSLDYLRAKYDTQYLGIHHIAHFAFSEGKAVAFVGAVPMPFLNNGTSYVGVQLCDYMTLPAFRRKGIHSELVQRILAMAKTKGADFAFAMHTNESLEGDPHIGWKLFEPLSVYVLEVTGNLITQSLNRFLPSLSQSNTKLKAALGRYLKDEFEQRAASLRDTFSVDYSPAYRKYREFGGSYSIALQGFEAWIKTHKVIEIGALNLLDKEKVEAGLNIIEAAAKKLGFRKMIIQLPPNSEFHAFLKNRTNGVVGYRPAIIPLKDGLSVTNLHLNAADFDTF